MDFSQLWSERKKLVLLGLLVILLVILLARQADFIPPGPAGRVVRSVIQPVVSVVATIDRTAEHWWATLFRSRELVKENRDLKVELALMRVRHERLLHEHNQLQRLSRLTSKLPDLGANVTANIISISSNFWTRTATIDRGRRDGIREDMPVINQDGLVGVIRDASANGALAQLLIDPDFAAGARVVETRDRGIVKGTGELTSMILVLENPQTPIEIGHEVVTSGLPIGSLFQPGTSIGRVTALKLDKFGQQYAEIEPSVRFDRLEEVVVLLETMDIDVKQQNIPPLE